MQNAAIRDSYDGSANSFSSSSSLMDTAAALAVSKRSFIRMPVVRAARTVVAVGGSDMDIACPA